MGKLLNKKLIVYLAVNRILIYLSAYFFVLISPDQKIIPFKSFFDFLLTFGKRWDGNSYTFIAQHWYVTSGSERFFIVFPPLYPLLIKVLDFFINNFVLSGIILSNIFFIAAMLIFYKLLRLDYDKKLSMFTIILISVFPTTFFFSVAYPESLFVLLFSLSIYLCRKKYFLYSGIAGGLAVLTRPFGILILPALLMVLLKYKQLTIKNLILITTPFALSSVIYLLINYFVYGDIFAFSKFLKQNWQKGFAFPWDGIKASWERGIHTTDNLEYKYIVGYGEALASTLAWLSIPIGLKYWKAISPYLIYLILGTLFFTSTGFILGAPRYLLSLPPFFILLAKIVEKNKFIKYTWLTISILLLFYISFKFSWGHWTY